MFQRKKSKKKIHCSPTCFFEKRQFVDRAIFKDNIEGNNESVPYTARRCSTPMIYKRKTEQTHRFSISKAFNLAKFMKSRLSIKNIPKKSVQNDVTSVKNRKKQREEFLIISKKRAETTRHSCHSSKQKILSKDKENVEMMLKKSYRHKRYKKTSKSNNFFISPWNTIISNDSISSEYFRAD